MRNVLIFILSILLCSCSYGTVGQLQSLKWYRNYQLEKDDLMDPASIPQLIDATGDFNRRIQIYAFHALGDLRPHSITAIPRAMEMIRSTDNAPAVRIAAVDFFYHLGPFVKGEVDELGEFLILEADLSVKERLVHALGSIGSPNALPFLKRVKELEVDRLNWAADLAIKRIQSFDIVDFCEEKTIEAIKEAPTFSYTDTKELDDAVTNSKEPANPALD